MTKGLCHDCHSTNVEIIATNDDFPSCPTCAKKKKSYKGVTVKHAFNG